MGEAKYFVGGVLTLLFVIILALLFAYYSAVAPEQVEVIENSTHKVVVYSKPDPALVSRLSPLFFNIAVAIIVIGLIIVGLAYLLEE